MRTIAHQEEEDGSHREFCGQHLDVYEHWAFYNGDALMTRAIWGWRTTRGGGVEVRGAWRLNLLTSHGGR